MKKKVILKGKGFILRPIKKEDEISIWKNANNKNISKNLYDAFPSPYTRKDAKDWIKKTIKKYKNWTVSEFVIDIDGKAVGAIGGDIKDKKQFKSSFGYWLGEEYWGKGIMTQAVKLYTNYIFKNFKNIVRISPIVYPWNKASQKVLLNNGFKLEGIMKKSYKKNGKIIDAYLFSKIRK